MSGSAARAWIPRAARPRVTPTTEHGRFRGPSFARGTGGAPVILSFDSDQFVERLFDGVRAATSGGHDWPALLPARDWAEPPNELLDAGGVGLWPESVGRREPVQAFEGTGTLDNALDAVGQSGAPWLRKLYLPIHGRFNVVTADLVCERRGWPRLDPRMVAEVGCVVRRLVPARGRERWADWVVGPSGGAWLEIEADDGAMRFAGAPTDPSEVPSNSLSPQDWARLGGREAGSARLVTTPLRPLPPGLGETRPSAAWFGAISLGSLDTERPSAGPEDVALASAHAKEAALATLDAAWGSAEISAASGRIRDAWTTLVDAIVGHRGTTETGNLRDGLPSMFPDRLSVPTLTPAAARALPDGTHHHGAEAAAALLWHVQSIRLSLANALGERPPSGSVPWDSPLNSVSEVNSPVSVTSGTVGSLADAIDVHLLAKDAPETPEESDSRVVVHRAARALEAAVADFMRPLFQAGVGPEDVLTRWCAYRRSFESTTDLPLAVRLREEGIDLRSPFEQGVLVFPGLDLDAALVESFRTDVSTWFDTAIAGMNGATDFTPLLLFRRLTGARSANDSALRPRLGPDHIYSVRCYARVRSVDPCQPARVVWSARTEPFTIAPPLDLLGLKPVAFSLPDLRRMARDLPRIGAARAAPFAVVTTPADSGFRTTDDPKDTARSWGVAFVCTFGIPVFTICAWILFSIILAILLMIPGFGWLLLLKFCLPVPFPKK